MTSSKFPLYLTAENWDKVIWWLRATSNEYPFPDETEPGKLSNNLKDQLEKLQVKVEKK